MRILSQKREGNKVFLEIEEEYSRFAASLNKTLSEIGKEMKIAGFRPGKAPKELVERNINPQALENQAVQNLIGEIYPQIVDQSQIQPIDYPQVEVQPPEKGKPFTFKLSVEVYPEVKLGKYKGLKVEKQIPQVKEEEISSALENLQKRFKKGNEELPLDDEFAKTVSGFAALAELKEEIRITLLKRKTIESEEEVKNKLIAEVVKETKVDLPSALVDREVDLLLNELKTSLAESNLTLEAYLKGIKKEEATLRQELHPSAEVRVRGRVVLHAIADSEKMAVTPEELEEEMKNLAEAAEKTREEFKKNLSQGFSEFIEDYLRRRKALDFLVKNAKIKEVKL